MWADLDPIRGHEQAGHRPVLVLSHELFNTRSETVVAVALTSRPQKSGFPLDYQIPSGIVPKPSWVLVSQIRLLSKNRLGRKLGHLQDGDTDRIVEGLIDIIGPSGPMGL